MQFLPKATNNQAIYDFWITRIVLWQRKSDGERMTTVINENTDRLLVSFEIFRSRIFSGMTAPFRNNEFVRNKSFIPE
jgi:hypothetical protein